ncbi:MAG: DNA polymerase III subunit delta [Anaerolineaceae bacterium]|nr:DNA polymerase III subunit delta [Anaerolineaceae bacterium]
MATTTFYIFHGDDDIAIQEAVTRLRKQMGDDANADLNISEYDGEITPAAEILNAARSLPFLADKRLVLVTGFLRYITRKGAGNVGKGQADLLLKELPELPDFTRLVFIERDSLPANNALVKFASSAANGYIKLFEVPKDTTQWIIKRAQDEYDAVIQPQAASALASVTASDLRRADNELVKLVSYVNGESDITEEHVTLLTPYVADANVFEMVDALAAGNANRALSLMNTVLEQDTSDPGFRLFGLIVRQFRLLLLTREHLDVGGAARGNAIAQAIGIRSTWQADKLARQSRAFTVEQLEAIYRRLQKYDLEMKTGQVEPRLALDLLVTSLSRQR